MYRISLIIFAAVLLLGTLAGCGREPEGKGITGGKSTSASWT